MAQRHPDMRPKPPVQATRTRLPRDWKTNLLFRPHRELIKYLVDDIDSLRLLALSCGVFAELTRPYRLGRVRFDVRTLHQRVRVRDGESGPIKVEIRPSVVSLDMQDCLMADNNLKRYVEDLTLSGDVNYDPRSPKQEKYSIYPSHVAPTSQHPMLLPLEKLIAEFQNVKYLTLEGLPVDANLLIALHKLPRLDTVTLRSVVFNGALDTLAKKPVPVRCLRVASVLSIPTVGHRKSVSITDVFNLDTLDEYALDYSWLDIELASYVLHALPKTIHRNGGPKCALSTFSCIADAKNILTICEFLASYTAVTITDLTLFISHELSLSDSVHVLQTAWSTMRSPASLQYLETLRCRLEIAHSLVPGRPCLEIVVGAAEE